MDGLINSTSITDFLDHLYYQKRVMDYDKQVLSALTDQSENIKKYNATLSKEAAKIESITSRLKGLEREISSQKNEQSKVVSKLSKERKLFEIIGYSLRQYIVALLCHLSTTDLSNSTDNYQDSMRKITDYILDDYIKEEPLKAEDLEFVKRHKKLSKK